jgi:lactoylglutathione lyase
VADLERSIDFYSRHFGLEHYFTQERVTPRLKAIAYLRSPQGVVEMMHVPEHSMGRGWHFCFVTDDFDGDYRRLVNDGVAVYQEPHPTAAREPSEESWQRCVFRGPDGEEIELRGRSAGVG